MIPGRGSQHWFRFVQPWSLVLAGAMLLLAGCRESRSNDASSEPADLTVTADTMTIDRVLRTDDRFSTLTAGLDSA